MATLFIIGPGISIERDESSFLRDRNRCRATVDIELLENMNQMGL